MVNVWLPGRIRTVYKIENDVLPVLIHKKRDIQLMQIRTKTDVKTILDCDDYNDRKYSIIRFDTTWILPLVIESSRLGNDYGGD